MRRWHGRGGRVLAMSLDAMNIPRFTLACLFPALMLPAPGFACGPSPGWMKKLDQTMQLAMTKNGPAPHRVIVRAVPGQVAAVTALLGDKAKVKAEHKSIHALSALADRSDVQALASSSAVLSL